MNAGAHQGCVADQLLWLKVLNPDGTIHQLQPTDLDYRYRTSNLQGSDHLVLEAAFQLEPGFDKAAVRAETIGIFGCANPPSPTICPVVAVFSAIPIPGGGPFN